MAEQVLITGASSDIGMELMRRLLAGSPTAKMLAHYFSGSGRITALAAEFPGRVIALQADLSDAEAPAALAREVLEKHGAPDGVVHLPALRPQPERFTKFNWSGFEADLAVQVRSIVSILGRLMPKISKLPQARIVFMLSSYVHGVPPKYMSSYNMVKYAQLGLMRSLAAEYAGTPVRINAVSPSMVETQFLRDLNELAVQGAAASHPMGRNATTADVVGAIVFLLGQDAQYINGITLPVAGGTVN